MSLQTLHTGPVHDIAWSVLRSRTEYDLFRKGKLSRLQFGQFLDSIGPELIAAGLPPEDVHFAKRYPRSESMFVSRALRSLARRGILPSDLYDSHRYEALVDAIQHEYHHGLFHTYIYPEEARLLFAIADIAKPRQAVFLGSFYGYWAYAAIATIAASGGLVTLVDPDPAAQLVAERNLTRAGLRESVNLVVKCGEEFLDSTPTSFDFVVLDAEGPRDHPDPDQRGKTVYGSLLRHALPHMPYDSYLVCHNILFNDICHCSFFERIIARNQQELASFLTLLQSEFPDFTECESTEGVGVGRRRPRV
jgi:predicted O-methyltransferase YrrM